MYSVPPSLLYMNSFLHFSGTKMIEVNGEKLEAIIHLLDKRFLNTSNIYDIQTGFPYCKIKDLDDYYYKIISTYPLNRQNIFYKLLQNSIILSMEQFQQMFMKGG